jgi:ABC-type uncharacterized transport system YnjBCD substrate-binding protein
MNGARTVRPRWIMAVLVALVGVAVATLWSGDGSSAPPDRLGESTWDEVLAAADGPTVRFWMWGGDENLNEHIDHDVAPAAARLVMPVKKWRLTHPKAPVKRPKARPVATNGTPRPAEYMTRSSAHARRCPRRRRWRGSR